MKKGLRQVGQCVAATGEGNEHRPDEKGIATHPSTSNPSLYMNEHRPDEKGIATSGQKKSPPEGGERTQT